MNPETESFTDCHAPETVSFMLFMALEIVSLMLFHAPETVSFMASTPSWILTEITDQVLATIFLTFSIPSEACSFTFAKVSVKVVTR